MRQHAVFYYVVNQNGEEVKKLIAKNTLEALIEASDLGYTPVEGYKLVKQEITVDVPDGSTVIIS